MVWYLEIRKYQNNNDVIYTVTPDFEILQYEDIAASLIDEEEGVVEKYNEDYYLEGVGENVKEIYEQIKGIVAELDTGLSFNFQKYYIFIKAGKNIAFLKIRNKKIRFIAMLPEEKIRECVKSHQVGSLAQSVQNFYNGPCARVDIVTNLNMNEIKLLLTRTLAFNKPN